MLSIVTNTNAHSRSEYLIAKNRRSDSGGNEDFLCSENGIKSLAVASQKIECDIFGKHFLLLRFLCCDKENEEKR
jgi:hypothetical protein